MNKLLDTIVDAIKDKKGERIVSLDLSRLDGAVCQHFVICSAASTSQVSAIAQGIEESTYKNLKEKVIRINGQDVGLWIAMDYGDIIVHIFQSELRDYYKLEELWGDAKLTSYED